VVGRLVIESDAATDFAIEVADKGYRIALGGG
jgi:hypothetical protein